MQIFFGVVYFETQLEGGSVVLEVAKQLISGGLERKLLSIFEDLLSSNYPEQMVCRIAIFKPSHSTLQFSFLLFIDDFSLHVSLQGSTSDCFLAGL